MKAVAEHAGTRAASTWWQHGSELWASLDADDRVVDANPRWMGLLGIEAKTLSARPFATLLHPRDAARAGVALAWTRARGAQQFVARCRHAGGHHVDVAWSLSPGPGGLLLASGREAPPGAAPAPPADAASARLQRLLAMSRLAGGIAHDFNNLLQTLRSALELLRRQPADPAGVQRLSESALRVVDHGARLTAQLLAASAAQRLQLGAVPVVPLLRQMQDLLRRTLPPQIGLQMELGGDGVSVLADQAQLENAVLELVVNACDAMQPLAQGGTVTLRCERALVAGDSELPTGEYLRLAVSDSGPGMSAAVRERAFEPFFTTRPPADDGHGRGLGLAQVHGFSRQCGGSTRIEASDAAGTTVSLLLPLLAGVPGSGAEPPTAAEPVAVVVAADDSPLRPQLCDSLRLLGYRAVPAADGTTALAALRRHAAEVVLIDMALEGGTGYGGQELARRARQAWPGVGIVLIADDGQGADAGGRELVLQRSFDLAALSSAVGRALGPAAPA